MELARTPIAAACLGLALAGCAGAVAGQNAGAPVPAVGADAVPASQSRAGAAAREAAAGIVPAGPAAESFSSVAGARPLPPPDALREAIVKEARAAARKAGRESPVADPRLDWAMTDLARQVRGDDLPAAEAVDFLLAHYGLLEPSPQILLAGTSAGGDDQVRDNARAQLAEVLRVTTGRIGVGIDRAGGELHVAIALLPSHVALLSPVPRRLPRAGRVEVVARIEAGYREPALVVTAPDGRVHEDPPSAVPDRLVGEVRCGGDGRYQVEIAANGPVGPAVLANFPVYCGVAPPARFGGAAGMRAETSDPAEVEREIVALVNRDRRRAKLPALAVDSRLTAVARAHCRDMAEHDFVGHVSPSTGNAFDRVHRAGLSPALVSENVGRAYSAEEAENGFLSSPGHRGNLLDPGAHRVGVGVVFAPPLGGTRPILVTQLFTN